VHSLCRLADAVQRGVIMLYNFYTGFITYDSADHNFKLGDKLPCPDILLLPTARAKQQSAISSNDKDLLIVILYTQGNNRDTRARVRNNKHKGGTRSNRIESNRNNHCQAHKRYSHSKK
jgi:hypothetical protein